MISRASTRPIVSTAMCRLLVDLLGGVPAPAGLRHGATALTDWESITAAVGLGSRPAAVRALSRNRSCKHCRVPQSHQTAMPVIKRHITRARMHTEDRSLSGKRMPLRGTPTQRLSDQRQIRTFNPSAPVHKYTVGYLACWAISGATNYVKSG